MTLSIKIVIWDWNGTLFDDVELCNKILNRMLARRGIAPCPRERYLQIFGFPIQTYYKTAGFDLENEPFANLAAEYMTEYTAGSDECGLAHGAYDALEMIKKFGAKQIILSASDLFTLSRQLQKTGCARYFDEVLGGEDILTRGKKALAIEWARRQKPGFERETRFVGDTLHDIETARAAGCECVLVSRGHQSCERLGASGSVVEPTLIDAARRICETQISDII